MICFDVSREWTILTPMDSPAVLLAARDLARILSLLRSQAGISMKQPPVEDGSQEAPDDSIPIIILNAASADKTENGFSWRLGIDRLEIYGDSCRGLCNGIYDFLKALDIQWLRPDTEILPRLIPGSPCEYSLTKASAHEQSQQNPALRRRMLITRETTRRDWDLALLWAFRNRIDGVILPLEERRAGFAGLFAAPVASNTELLEAVNHYSFILEAGGWALSLLMPRNYFFSHRDLFRMDGGKRVRLYNFCPTNPGLQRFIRDALSSFLRQYPDLSVLHLWPDRRQETAWCSCPTCRAFTPEEQNRIAVNAAADILLELNPSILVSYWENTTEPVTIKARASAFQIAYLPGQAQAESVGMFLAEEWRRVSG